MDKNIKIKKVLFVNPPDEFLKKKGDRPPIGLLSLAAYARRNGHNVNVWDCNHDHFSSVLASEYGYIFFGSSPPTIEWVINKSRSVKRRSKRCRIAVGGMHVSNIQEDKVLKVVDWVVVGDGENAVDKILNGRAPIKGVVKSVDVDISDLPLPAYDLVDMYKYDMKFRNKKAAMVVTSRGCRYNCAFCGSAKIKKVRFRSVQNVIQELRLLYNDYDIRSFYFGDDIFTVDKNRTLILCDEININFPDVEWRCTTRADLLDDTICRNLYRAGCRVVSLGLESGSDVVLKTIHKGMTVEQQRRGVELCHKWGMDVKAFFIFGLPGETVDTAKETLEFAASLKIRYADFYPFVPFPGTPIWDDDNKYGVKIIKDNSWQNFNQVGDNINFVHPNLSSEDIMRFVAQGRAMMEGLTYEK